MQLKSKTDEPRLRGEIVKYLRFSAGMLVNWLNSHRGSPGYFGAVRILRALQMISADRDTRRGRLKVVWICPIPCHVSAKRKMIFRWGSIQPEGEAVAYMVPLAEEGLLHRLRQCRLPKCHTWFLPRRSDARTCCGKHKKALQRWLVGKRERLENLKGVLEARQVFSDSILENEGRKLKGVSHGNFEATR